MSIQPVSVSECLKQIKYTLEGQFRALTVEGEVSNLTRSGPGHWYFTLSDQDSSLSIALFKMDALRNPQIKQLKNGDQIICQGGLGVYTKRGTFQLIAKRVIARGKGGLKERYEALKAKLTQEGLFDIEKKKSIPSLPKRIALITARQAAALHDFVNVYKRRSYFMDLLLVPAVMQGENSATEVCKALDKIEKYNSQYPNTPIEAVVITRGGGSLEDLWSFNDEKLVRKIFQYPIPVISAIGHEVDITLCDYVSDLRCETPTAAAEYLTNYQRELSSLMTLSKTKLENIFKEFLADRRQRVAGCHPQMVKQALLTNLQQAQARLGRVNVAHRGSEMLNLHEKILRLEDMHNQLSTWGDSKKTHFRHLMERTQRVLDAVGPKNILKRGYIYCQDEEGKMIMKASDFKELKKREKIALHFADGEGYVEKT